MSNLKSPELNAKRYLKILAVSVTLFAGILIVTRQGHFFSRQADQFLLLHSKTNATQLGPTNEQSKRSKSEEKTTAQVNDAYGKLPMQFERNLGQQQQEVKFLSRGQGYTLFLKPSGAVFSLTKRLPTGNKGAGFPHVDSSHTSVVGLEFVGSRPDAQISGQQELPGKVNYLIGNDPKKWRTDISTYREVKYFAVYPGIDLVYHGNQRNLEYDFVVAPHANPASISLRFSGIQSLRLDQEGSLVLVTSNGEEVRQPKPVIYQESGNNRTIIAGSYLVNEANEVRFKIGIYDQTRELVIDPTLVYSTYLGGNDYELANDVAVDATGAAYVCGYTQSLDFPVLNAQQPQPGNPSDAFITKINAAGNALVYSTYLGGNSYDDARGIALDASANVYVTGGTISTNFPTVNPRQGSSGGMEDAYITKLNAGGNALIYSTYLGGNQNDVGQSIVVDAANNAYITGGTQSTNFPTLNPRQATHGGSYDAFVSKLGPTGDALVYSTFHGGSGLEFGNDIVLDSSQQAYVVGFTESTNFPTTANARQNSNGGNQDGWISKFSNAGNTLLSSSYLGGSGNDSANSIAFLAPTTVFVAGDTSSPNFPTASASQTNFGGNTDAFVCRINATGNFDYSTYLGGSSQDSAGAIAIDSSGIAYVGGFTQSVNFPLLSSMQSMPSENGGIDAFLTRITSGGAIGFSTYLGGTNDDFITGIAKTTSGVYVVGQTGGFDFPITSGSFQTTKHAGYDGFITRIDESTNPVYRAIRGHIAYAGGAPAAGVSVQLSGTQSKTVLTSVNGNYVFQLLPLNGNFTVTPDPTLATNLPQRTYNPLANNVPDADFVSNKMVQISGKVDNFNSRGLQGIRVDLSGSASSFTQTDSDGMFSFLLPAGGNYTVAPNDFRVNAWLPTNTISHTALVQDVTGDDFRARFPSFSVSGKVRNANGTVVYPGVTVRLVGPSTIDLTTANDGLYTAVGLNSLSDYAFTPLPFTVGGVTYNVSPNSASFLSMTTCDLNGSRPPGSFCSGFDYLGMDFVASPAPVDITIQTNPIGRTVSIDGGGPLTAPQTVQWIPGSAHTITTTTNQSGSVGTRYVWSSWNDLGAISHGVTAPNTTTTYTANFTTQHQLTMVAGSNGSVLPASGSFFNQGTSVQISATPNSGFSFSSWVGTGTGSFTGSTNPVNVTMNGPITQTASFTQNPVQITVQTNPAGRTVSIDGGAQLVAPQSVQWTPGTSHTIATTSPQSGTAGTQFVWSSWSDGLGISHSVTAPNTTTTYTANFTTQFQLTMSAGSGGTVLPANGFFNSGQSVQITATPNSGFSFSGWTGTGTGSFTGSTNPVNVTMNGPIIETAAFTQNQVQINLQTSPVGRTISIDGGAPLVAPQSVQWTPGTSHTITTTSPQTGPAGTQFVWSSWSDGLGISHSVTAPNVNTTYTANFTTQFQLTMSAGTGGTVLPANGFFDSGQSVQITATPNSGFTFTGWTGTGTGSFNGSTNPVNITMNGPISETASFSQTPVQISVQSNPAGRTVSIDGGPPTTAPVSVQWSPGSSHTIATTSPQAGTADTQFVWSSWSDGLGISHSVTAPNIATTYTANFTTQFQLTTTAGSGGTVLPASGFFNSGQSVQITATPNSGFTFTGWTGTGTGSFTGSTNPVNVTMNGPISETASFTQTPTPTDTVQFSANGFTASEAGTQISVTITRTVSTAAASVDYATSDTAAASNCDVINHVASSRCDYLITLGTLQFDVGETSKTINIPVVDDVYAEGSETFTITLSNPTGASLGTPFVAALTINDNDSVTGVNPIDTAGFFVRQHYVDFLNREPDTNGLNFWTNEITSCGSNSQCLAVKRINVSAAFFLSIEFQETGYLVYRIYRSSFGNLPAAPVPVRFIDFLKDTQQIGKGVQVGIGDWQAKLEANKQAYVLAFVQRSDFLAAFPNSMTADQFVTNLDTNAGGVLSPTEKANLIAVLGATPGDITKRASVLRSVAEDSDLRKAEFNKAFVLMQYFGYLRRNPNDAPDSDFGGLNFWLGKLNSFNGDFVGAEMVKAFILSGEYRHRFGP